MPDRHPLGPSGLRSQVNVLPMIDVMLVLIVIFMILSIRPPAIHLQLSESEDVGAGRVAGTETIVLELDSVGGYRLNRQPLPVESLSTMLHRVFDGRSWRVLHIRSAANRRYEEVIDAADVAKTAGIQIVGLMLDEPGATARRR